MNKKSFLQLSVTVVHYIIVVTVCLLTNACSNDDGDTTLETLSLEHNLYIVDNDTVPYDFNEMTMPLNATDEQICSALEEYSMTMLAEYSQDTENNTILSPMNATLMYSMISCMTDETSGNDCYKQMGLENYDVNDVNSYCRKLNYHARQYENTSVEGSKFSMSNNCWIQEKESVYKSFISTTKSFGINVKGTDLQNRTGLDRIKQSLGESISSITNGTEMTFAGNVTSLVTSSLDLQKKWKYKISYISGDTIFNNADGTISTCRKIGGTVSVNYSKQETFDMFELPYSDDNFSLYIVYPQSSYFLNQSIASIQNKSLEKCINDLSTTTINIRVPAISLDGTTELYPSEKAQSTSIKPFYQAKLYKASPKAFSIGNTYQAYHIELNPQATSINIVGTALITIEEKNQKIAEDNTTAPRPYPGGTVKIPTIHIEHPFILLIRNNNLKTIVYACCIKDLKQ